MGFDALLGNDRLKQNLTRSLSKGHVSHFYLISGPEGSGKHTLAKLLAAAILCQGEDKPCGRCTPCRKVMDGSHPDFITVDDPEKKTVTVDLIRQARADVYIQPNESEYKIYMFPRAQDMGLPGQNALLKILEEPPKYGVFLLLTDNPDKLLPTVRSRCTELNMQALPEDAQMVENVAFDDGDFIQTYQLSGGAYVQLLRYAQGDVTLDGIVAGDWPGATDIQSMALETVGGYAAKGLMLSVEPEDEEAVRVALVLVSADRCALVYQAVYPQRLGDDQIDDAVQRMVDSMDVLGGSAAKDVG